MKIVVIFNKYKSVFFKSKIYNNSLVLKIKLITNIYSINQLTRKNNLKTLIKKLKFISHQISFYPQ
jgi:hypothetical protein